MSNRERFAELLARREELGRLILANATDATAAIIARVREYKPRWKGDDFDIRRKAVDRLELWEIVMLRAPIQDAYFERDREFRSEKSWIDTQLDRLAQVTSVRVGTVPVWHVYREVWGSTYASQGWGAKSYAKGRADLVALEVSMLGVQSRVTERPRESTEVLGRRRKLLSDWLVEVRVAEQLDVEILRRLPGAELRDILKACWGRGLNPRVYYPGLPHGIEKKLGIDYQGREVADGA